MAERVHCIEHIICLLFSKVADERGVELPKSCNWPSLTDRTFSDAITAVRRWLWTDWVFAAHGNHRVFSKLSRPIKAMLMYALAPAA
ncbi:MAG TPA: hypothetical protein PLL20_11735 [Phycisphaerae bacterium]|nr:hypothetical protein [Phycisphaerae bacterium]HRR83450.1 hypothetical protein [Phycisphaerae bacterium]